GFKMCIEPKNRDTFGAIVDITVAIESYKVKLGAPYPITLLDLYKAHPTPLKFHVFIKKYDINEVPYKDATKWLMQLFSEKEDLLNYFNEHKKFPGKSEEDDLIDWKTWIYSALYFLFYGWINLFLWKKLPSLLACMYGFILFVVFVVFIVDYKIQQP